MTKTRIGYGQNPDAPFVKMLGSRALYHNGEKLSINAQNRKTPPAAFSRVKLSKDSFIWVPTNEAGEAYLRGLTQEQQNEFLYHEPPVRTEPVPESRRVVDSRPVKGLPNGHREADYFDAITGTPRTSGARSAQRPKATSYTKVEAEAVDLPDSEIDVIRAAISAGTFGSKN